MAKPPGVFLLEGQWTPKLTGTDSVLPLITYMRGIGMISSMAHRYVDTTEGLLQAARQWGQKQYDHLQLGYFGFHGDPGALRLGRTLVPLDDLAEVLRARCGNRIIYFGSCSVFAGKADETEHFLKITGARAVIGYTRDVEWVESSAFDLLLFDALTRYQRLRPAETWLRTTHRDFCDRLGLRWLHRAPGRTA